MKHIILTAAALFSFLGTRSPAAVTTIPVARPAAAASLTQALQTAGSGPEAFQTLVRAGEAVRDDLGESRYATLLGASLENARWRAVVDEERARRWLVQELKRAAQDLAFEPFIEAELPVGFPAPTPVQEIQLKRFPGYRMAFTPTASANGGFWTLFNHIKRNDIAMTAPVEMTYERGVKQARMAFLYRSTELGETGTDGTVEVVDIEAAWAVSIGCRGANTREAMAEARRLLESWIGERDDLEIAGDLRLMGYNSPMVSTSRRYFEVQIPVRFAEGRVW